MLREKNTSRKSLEGKKNIGKKMNTNHLLNYDNQISERKLRKEDKVNKGIIMNRKLKGETDVYIDYLVCFSRIHRKDWKKESKKTREKMQATLYHFLLFFIFH